MGRQHPKTFGIKGSKTLKLPPVRNCFTLAMTNKLVVIINSLKVPKIKKLLLHKMKFLVPNYSCLQNPWLGGYAPRSPFSLSSTEFVEPPPAQNSWVRHCIPRVQTVYEWISNKPVLSTKSVNGLFVSKCIPDVSEALRQSCHRSGLTGVSCSGRKWIWIAFVLDRWVERFYHFSRMKVTLCIVLWLSLRGIFWRSWSDTAVLVAAHLNQPTVSTRVPYKVSTAPAQYMSRCSLIV